MDKGWICLHRKILNWEWYDDANTFRLFFHLLLTANYKDSKWRGETIKRGQVVIGRKKIAEELGLSEQNIRTSLNKLKSTNEITIEVTNKYTVVTLCNYSLYQDEKEITNQPINQQTNQQLTNNQPTTNQQLTTSKQSNKVTIKQYNNTTTPKPPSENFDSENNIFDIYQEKLGLMSGKASRELIGYAQELSEDVLKLALDEAIDRGATNWSYISAILARCKAEGVKTKADWERRKKPIKGARDKPKRDASYDIEKFEKQILFETPVYQKREA